MKQEAFDKKVPNQILLFLYEKQIAQYNDVKSSVGFQKVKHQEILENVPKAIFKEYGALLSGNSRYFQILEYNGHIQEESNRECSLTVEGFRKAKRLKQPIKYFFIDNWQLIVSAFLGTVFTLMITEGLDLLWQFLKWLTTIDLC